MKKARYNLKQRMLALILVLASLIAAFSFTGCEEEPEPDPTIPADAPVLEWRSDGLFAQLPPPITGYGRILKNTDSVIEMEYFVTDKSQFAEYVQLCVNNGYNQSMKNSEFFYSASNDQGYKFSAQYKDSTKTVSVVLDASAVKVTALLGSEELAGRPYAEAVDILKGLGFSNVVLKAVPIEDDSEYEDFTVESVTVDSTPLVKDALLPKSSTVSVRFYKRNISLNVSASEMSGKHYDVVGSLLASAGFVNIVHKEELAPANSGLDSNSDRSVISVSINGREDFQVGDSFSPNAIVTITHLSMDIVLSAASGSYNQQNAETVAEGFRTMGFKNVTLKPTQDFSGVKNPASSDRTVAKISINGDAGFAAGERYSRFATVEIEYYLYYITIDASAAEIKAYLDYREAEEYFKELGFVKVSTAKGSPLINGWVHQEGEVSSISVNGKTNNFSSGAVYSYDTLITVYYYYFQ